MLSLYRDPQGTEERTPQVVLYDRMARLRGWEEIARVPTGLQALAAVSA